MQIELNNERKNYGFDQQLMEDLPIDRELTVKFKEPIRIKGSLEKLNNNLGLLKFHLTGNVIYPCSRCLDEVVTPIDYEFDEQVDIVDNDIFDLDEYIHDCLFINEPVQIICKEDCKGLCPICGTNLNINECNCQLEEEEEIDPRLAKLKQLL